MKVSDYIHQDLIFFNLPAKKKKEILEEIVSRISHLKKFSAPKKKKILSKLFERERLGSTAIGQGIALPHARVDFIKKVILTVSFSKEGLDFESLDGEKVHMIFLLISPESMEGVHLKMLANISRLLRDRYFLERLRSCRQAKEVKSLIETQEIRL